MLCSSLQQTRGGTAPRARPTACALPVRRCRHSAPTRSRRAARPAAAASPGEPSTSGSSEATVSFTFVDAKEGAKVEFSAPSGEQLRAVMLANKARTAARGSRGGGAHANQRASPAAARSGGGSARRWP